MPQESKQTLINPFVCGKEDCPIHAELQLERAKFQTLFAQVPAGVLAVSAPSGKLLYLNDHARTLFAMDFAINVEEGVPVLELVAKSGTKVYLSDGSDCVRQEWPISRSLKGEEIIDAEVQVVSEHGTRRVFLVSSSPLRTNDLGIIGAVAVMQDITNRKEFECIRSEQNSYSSLLMDSVHQLVWGSKPSGEPEFLNRYWREFTGLTMEECTNFGWLRAIHPEDVDFVRRQWSEAISEERPAEGEARFRRGSDGTYRWHLARAFPMKNARGEVVRWIGSATDIHDQKRTAEAYRFLATVTKMLQSDLDYTETLRRAAEVAVPWLCDYCVIDLMQEGKLNPVAISHRDPKEQERLWSLRKENPYRLESQLGPPQVLRSGTSAVFNLEELASSDAKEFAEYLDWANRVAAKSWMIVPIRSGQEIVGTILFGSCDLHRRYGPDDLVFAIEIATRCSIALENARRYRDEQKSHERAEMLVHKLQLVQSLASELAIVSSFEEVAGVMTGHGSKVFGSDGLALAILQSDSSSVRVHHVRGALPEGESHWQTHIRDAKFPSVEAAVTGRVIIIESQLEGLARYPIIAEQMLPFPIHSVVGVPLALGTEKLGGMAFVFGKARKFSNEDVKFFRLYADISAQALHRVLRLEAERRSQQELRGLSRRLHALQEEERSRVANEIHDELGQALAVFKIETSEILKIVEGSQPQVEKHLRHLGRKIDETIAALRRISSELKPMILEDLGIAAAIEWLAGDFHTRTGISVKVETDAELPPISAETSLALFRIFQESLTNVLKHARCKRVEVSLWSKPPAVTLEVRDFGIGFNYDGKRLGGSLGILGMRERAASLNGTFFIESATGRGTRIVVEVPTAKEHGSD